MDQVRQIKLTIGLVVGAFVYLNYEGVLNAYWWLDGMSNKVSNLGYAAAIFVLAGVVLALVETLKMWLQPLQLTSRELNVAQLYFKCTSQVAVIVYVILTIWPAIKRRKALRARLV